MKRRRIGLPAVIAVIAAMALAPLAHATTPAPGYGQFAGCPSPSEKTGILACIHSVVKGGNFKMGSKNVPITNPMTLSGGINGTTGAIEANSKGGLSQAKQKVPGGVVGLTGLTWLLEVLGSEALTLYAVTELAGQPAFIEGGEFLNLPIKVHLVNSVLGNSCYVGSFSNPINLHLTLGTTSPPPPNKPITGSKGEVAFDPSTSIIHETNMRYVDNAFSAPAASGCTLTLFGFIPIDLDGLVDLQAGLPAAAGTNETVQELDSELVNSAFVYP